MWTLKGLSLFHISSGPSWFGVDANGLLTGTPSNDDVGSNDVTIAVTDNEGGQVGGGIFL